MSGRSGNSGVKSEPQQVCTCAALRRASRRVTQYYDIAMRPAALKLTQFSLLRNIAREQDQSLTALAERVAMDRTTLTRNLRPLQRAGLIVLSQGRDSRSRVVEITSAGVHRVEAALPYWREAERKLRAILGEERSRELHALLGELTDV